MKTLSTLRILLSTLGTAIVLQGCATTELSYDPNGITTWKSTTLWKDVKDADVQWGDMKATLGSSVGNGGESRMMNSAIACYLSPELCKP